MEAFTKKLRLLHQKMFHQDIDKFTEAFIDYNKFHAHKFNFKSPEESRKKFFSNRKTVLRRWLLNGIKCTADFRKSFPQYQISKYQFQNQALFSLGDFESSENLLAFEKRLDAYLLYQQQAHVTTDYQHLYLFDESTKTIQGYKITQWMKSTEENKGTQRNVSIRVEQSNGKHYEGTLTFKEDNNIFITLQIAKITLYMLFHDSNDASCPYIVGTSMGYLPKDNKVPRAEKVILAKEKLPTDDLKWQYILNETEVVAAVENRLNLQGHDLGANPFNRYSTMFKKYRTLFRRFITKKFQTNFYYRLAFREFFALSKLFEKVAQKESYFTLNQERAFFELIQTLEAKRECDFYMVIEHNPKNLFFPSTLKSMEMKKRFLNLYTFGVQSHLIFIVEETETLPSDLKTLLEEMHKHHISLHLVSKKSILHEVNSIDFFFIHEGTEEDFVFADPLRDSKDVYKIFINSVTMEEYRIDYQKILNKSIEYPPNRVLS